MKSVSLTDLSELSSHVRRAMQGAVACTLAVFLATTVPTDEAHSLSLVDQGSTTLDPNTGLVWLDLTASEGYSYDFVSSQFGAIGLFEGYRYATQAEVTALWANAGIPAPYVFGNNNNAATVSNLMALLGGPLGSCGFQCAFSFGMYGDHLINQFGIDTGTVWEGELATNPNLYPGVAVIEHNGVSVGNAGDGLASYLVRAAPSSEVPLPAALPLFASGLGALGLIGWRRKRKKARAAA